MDELPLNMPRYPMLRFVVRHGVWLTVLGSAMLGLLGVALLARTGDPLTAALFGLAAMVTFVGGMTAVELVRLVTDMLLPR